MNKQQEMQRYFNRAVSGVLKQKCSAYNLNNDLKHCAYRGKQNTKCAIGFLIPDFKYDKIIEGVAIEELIQSNSYVIPVRWKRYKQFLIDLQLCHDNNIDVTSNDEFISSFVRAAEFVADKYNLSTEVIKQYYQPKK